MQIYLSVQSEGGRGPPPTNTYQPSAEICEGMNVVLYSNNLYKYILPGWLSVPCPLSSIRALVCVWKTYYYYCIINKEDVQACLVSICIMYVPLSKIECNSQNIVLSLGLISVSYMCAIYLSSTSWNFAPACYPSLSFLFEHQSFLRRGTFYHFICLRLFV